MRRPLFEIGALLDAGYVHPARSGRNHLRWLAASNGVPDAAHRRGARPRRAHRRRRSQGARLLARDAPAPRAGRCAARRPAHRHPRRAGQRPRPGGDPVDPRRARAPRSPGPDGARQQPPAVGDRADGRRPRRDRAWPAHRAGPGEQVHRAATRPVGCGCARRRRPRSPSSRASSAGNVRPLDRRDGRARPGDRAHRRAGRRSSASCCTSCRRRARRWRMPSCRPPPPSPRRSPVPPRWCVRPERPVIDAIRSEWIKVSTITVDLGARLLSAVAFPLVVTVLTAHLAPRTSRRRDPLAGVITGTDCGDGDAARRGGLLGITNEFSHGTIRPTFAAMPDRWRPLLAKPIVQATLASVVTAADRHRGLDRRRPRSPRIQSLDDGAAPPSSASSCSAIGLTLLGYGLGLLIRNSAAAICLLLLWPLIAEGLIAGLLSVAGAEEAGPVPALLGRVQHGGHRPDPTRFGRVAGGAYFFAWVAVILVLGARTRRATPDPSRPGPMRITLPSGTPAVLPPSRARPRSASSSPRHLRPAPAVRRPGATGWPPSRSTSCLRRRAVPRPAISAPTSRPVRRRRRRCRRRHLARPRRGGGGRHRPGARRPDRLLHGRHVRAEGGRQRRLRARRQLLRDDQACPRTGRARTTASRSSCWPARATPTLAIIGERDPYTPPADVAALESPEVTASATPRPSTASCTTRAAAAPGRRRRRRLGAGCFAFLEGELSGRAARGGRAAGCGSAARAAPASRGG